MAAPPFFPYSLHTAATSIVSWASSRATNFIGSSYGWFGSCQLSSAAVGHPTHIKGWIHLTLCSLSGSHPPSHI